MASHDSSLSAEEIRKANTKKVIRIALILFVVTVIEFALAFIWPDGSDRTLLNILFIVLTIVKAFYIVSEFMHLGHEVPVLMYSIVLPLVFIVWLVVALMNEGSAIFSSLM
ncbi:cytochrome C oxidase subunit IV family protein [Chondrinema litorale]|uniref:cytochrome C oxidase subunit IV family protein n=1 Tax=Chondrinema litorale TaxID=2994555 RepID=UPI002543F8BB|nr:cytochrome C oxidase subunit IV family protein [Chondrinema litorale]UZR93686.1 cytochrome C oxidase subunit IV family protein [Chondrinema litorale]